MDIILIDDDADCLSSLKTALCMVGFAVQAFLTPEPAIAAFEQQPNTVVITDYHLPDMNGDEITQKLCQKNTGAVVIVVSGDTRGELEVLSRQAGACAFLRKPLNLEELLDTIRDSVRGIVSGIVPGKVKKP